MMIINKLHIYFYIFFLTKVNLVKFYDWSIYNKILG